MSHRLATLASLASLAFASLTLACTMGVIPRDVPPEPPPAEPAPASAEPGAEPPSSAAGPAPVDYRIVDNHLELPGPIVFTAGQDQLDPASDPALEHARGYLAAKESITMLRIEGHADDQVLSERRAVAVARWLIAHGVDCKRLLAVGFGATKPVADPGTPDGKAQNTRVELHNAAMRGRPIGGASLEGGGQVASVDLCQ